MSCCTILAVCKRKQKKNKTPHLSQGLTPYIVTAKFFSFFGRRVVSLWTILLNFQNTKTVAHREMLPFSRRENRTALWRYLRFYEWFNGNVLPLAFQQYLENIPVCTLMLFSSFGWKEKALATHLARSVFPLYFCLLSSFSRMFRNSGFSSVHRETEHVFCFSPPVCFRRYIARSGRTTVFFFNSRDVLNKNNTTKQFSKVSMPRKNSDLKQTAYRHMFFCKTYCPFTLSFKVRSTYILHYSTKYEKIIHTLNYKVSFQASSRKRINGYC